MASIETGGGGGEKGKPKKLNLRVDFTPMVDMNMLLLTFFMFCTTLSKPQVMDIAMPTNDKNIDEEDQSKVKESEAITLLLGAKDKVYYYQGMPNYEDYTTLKESDYSAEGLRAVLLKNNKAAIEKMRELKLKRVQDKRFSEEEFRKEATAIKGEKGTPTVVIKPTDESTYKNLVDALDEMQICSIGKYAIVEMTDADRFLLENFNTKGAFGKENLTPAAAPGKKK